MSRFTLLMLLPIILLAGCSQQGSDNSGSGGGGSSSGGGSSTSSSGGGGGGGPDPDPTDNFPSSGIPDQNSLTVLVETLNPRGRNAGNTVVPITVLLADQLGNTNTIPDGTQIYFAADGGGIQSSGEICTTTNAECSTNWRSQNPIPFEGPTIEDPLGSGEDVVSYSSGRATILVWTEGIESFIDNNANGLFDDGDLQVDDIGDAFLDKDENGLRDNNEEFVDFPIPQLGGGGEYTEPDELYSGPNCSHSTDCATGTNAQSLFIFQNVEIVMSSDSVCIVDVDPSTLPDYYTTVDYDVFYGAQPINITTTRSFTFLFHDCYGNPPMSGTSIGVESIGNFSLFGAGCGTVPNTNVDMGGTPPAVEGGLLGTRLRYPSNSLVCTVVVSDDPEDADPDEEGELKVSYTNAVGTQTLRVITLLDP